MAAGVSFANPAVQLPGLKWDFFSASSTGCRGAVVYLLLPLSIKLKEGRDCVSSGADVKFPNVTRWTV